MQIGVYIYIRFARVPSMRNCLQRQWQSLPKRSMQFRLYSNPYTQIAGVYLYLINGEAGWSENRIDGSYGAIGSYEHAEYPLPNQTKSTRTRRLLLRQASPRPSTIHSCRGITVFIGQGLALPLYFILKKRDPESFRLREQEAKKAGKSTEVSIIRVGIIAVFDVIATVIQAIALNFIAGSAFQMLRSGTVVSTFIFTVLYLKRKALRNQIVGSILAVVGVVLVGTANLAFSASSGSNQSTTLEIMGYMMCVCALFLNGFQYAYEQGIFEKYYIDPMKMAGIEGTFGLTFAIVLVAVFTFIPCSFGQNVCVFTDAGGFLERPEVYLRELSGNNLLMTFCIIYAFTIMTFCVAGIHITRYINALARTVCGVSKIILVWIVCIVVTLTVGKNQPKYRWERTEVGAIVLQLAGFVLIVLGNLVYNKLIVLWRNEQPQEEGLLVNPVDEE